jgi:hypothetical protein
MTGTNPCQQGGTHEAHFDPAFCSFGFRMSITGIGRAQVGRGGCDPGMD